MQMNLSDQSEKTRKNPHENNKMHFTINHFNAKAIQLNPNIHF